MHMLTISFVVNVSIKASRAVAKSRSPLQIIANGCLLSSRGNPTLLLHLLCHKKDTALRHYPPSPTAVGITDLVLHSVQSRPHVHRLCICKQFSTCDCTQPVHYMPSISGHGQLDTGMPKLRCTVPSWHGHKNQLRWCHQT